ncbi:MAG: hypothetical protein LBK53_08340 [Heliobacteriaceae bacterium]|jgi:predicted Zn-dependent protease|nr:hypothetical protein [Heliobacteriaceae bacterium]
MNKKIIVLLAALLALSACVYAEEEKSEPKIDVNKVYYPNATVQGGMNKYSAGNYTGCLQEMISVLKKNPSNPVANYYTGLSFIQIGDNENAVKYFDKVIAQSPNKALVQYATQAKDCLNGAESCKEEESELDKFIKNPYSGSYGFSPEADAERRQKELNIIRQKINENKEFNKKETELIKKLDGKSDIETGIKIAYASDEDILKAVKTLKDAGVQITVTPAYQDPQMAEMQMMMGNNNNNPMWNMVPFMMTQQEGKNIDPQVIQAMMMQSMMPDFGVDSNNR